MDELKKQLAAMCERDLDYYDIVNESAEAVEYGLIIDFLFERVADMMQGRDDHEKESSNEKENSPLCWL